MGITSGASISSYAVHETLPTQAEAVGNNQIVVSDDIANIAGNNGQVTGTDYIGRIIILNLAGEGSTGVEQTRLVTADVAGTGNLRILTVSEDWSTNPSTGTTDTIHVFYNMIDCENVTTEYNTRTGFYEMTNPIIVGNGTVVGGLFIGNGELIEIEDSKSATVYSLEVQSSGRLQVGYLQEGAAVAGAYLSGINNSTGETWTIFESGSEGRLYDARFFAGLQPLQFNMAAGSNVEANNFSIFQGTDEGLYFDAQLYNGSITGGNTAVEDIRVNSGTYFENMALINLNSVTTAAADTTTETLTFKGCAFIGNTDDLVINSNKTWNIVNPSWAITTYTDAKLNWLTGTLNYVYDQRSIDAIVQEADGTKLQDAVVNVYENTTANLVTKLTSAVTTGLATGTFDYKLHATNSSTTTYSGHALQAGKWLYLPFVATQSSTDFFDGTILLSPDNNIVQTTQATAVSAGSAIVWHEDTNPSSIFEFTAGAGGTIGLAVGDTITGGTSGATGVVTKILTGDSTAGTIHLKDRNATATFTNGETINNGADGWTASYTAGTQQDFSIWVDAAALAYQTAYDYYAAITTETTLGAAGEIVWEWCRDGSAQALFSTGTNFYTEMSNAKGLIVITTGSGNVDYFTDDLGGTWSPPISVTFKLTGIKTDSEIRLYNNDITTSRDTEISGTETSSSTLQSVTLLGGGTGYTVNDKITLVGGTFTTAAILNVDSVAGGVITGVSVDNAGSGYTDEPSVPTSVTGGTGSGATVSGTFSGTFSYTYVYTTDINMTIVIFNLYAKDIRLQGVSLTNSNQSIPIQQNVERNYLAGSI